jgi:hypothetical protein
VRKQRDALSIGILTASVALLGGGVMAAAPPAPDAWRFLADKHDADHDGKITREEYDRGKDAFARLDRDRDGVLTPADFEQKAGARNERPKLPNSGRPDAKVGATAPDFELERHSGAADDAKVKLSSFSGKTPVALVFGSFT